MEEEEARGLAPSSSLPSLPSSSLEESFLSSAAGDPLPLRRDAGFEEDDALELLVF